MTLLTYLAVHLGLVLLLHEKRESIVHSFASILNVLLPKICTVATRLTKLTDVYLEIFFFHKYMSESLSTQFKALH